MESIRLTKTYRYRLSPTRNQDAFFRRQAGARRFVYNWGLARQRAWHAEHGTHMKDAVLSAELTALKKQPGLEWLGSFKLRRCNKP